MMIQNTVPFASSNKVGATKHFSMRFLVLGGEAARVVLITGLPDDPIVMISVASKNASNSLTRQIFMDTSWPYIIRD